VRIAYLTPQYLPAVGGIERHVAEIARRAARDGGRVEILTQTATPGLPAVEELHGVVVRRFRAVNGSAAYGLPPGLLAWVARHAGARFDVVHAHGYHALPALAAVAARRPAVVFTPHYHGDGHTPAARALHRVYRPFGRLLFRRADAVIAVSHAERRLVERDFPRVAGRLRVIPNGVDAGPIVAAAPYPRQAPTVVSVGRLEAYKRVDALVDAVARLAGVELVVIGDGPARPALERRVAAAGLASRVHVLGRVPDAELHRWLRSADVVASLSLHEAFGITLLEGAAAGARVLASRIPAHEEVAAALPGTALVPVEAGADAVAEALVGAIRAGRGAAVPVPSWDDVTARTTAVYRAAGERRAA
jgi:glycosyltransferase involved in cell wall biosynthesis